MLPITRANFQCFCRMCLRELTVSEITYDIDQKMIDDNKLFPQKICPCCYIKTIALKKFQDRAYCSTGILKFIAEEKFNDKKSTVGTAQQEMMERLKNNFCRLCLKENTKPKEMNDDIIKAIKECIGLEIEKNLTVINCTQKAALADDPRYPRSICVRCHTNLRGFVEYRKMTKQNIDYLQSLLDECDEDENDDVIGRLSPISDKGLIHKQEENDETERTQIESIELPSTTFDSKAVVNFEQKELTELLSEPEDVFDVDTKPESDDDDDSDDSKPLVLLKAIPNKDSNIKKKFKDTDVGKPKLYKRKSEKEIAVEKDQQLRPKRGKQLKKKRKNGQKSQQKLNSSIKLITSIEDTSLQNIMLETVESPIDKLKAENFLDYVKTEIDDIKSDHENQISSGEEFIQESHFHDESNSETEDLMHHLPIELSKNVTLVDEILSNEDIKANKDELESRKSKEFVDIDDASYASSNSDSDSSYYEKKLKKTKSRKKHIIRKKSSLKEEKPKYKCEQCNKSFFKKHTIEAHMKSHEGTDKPFACKECSSSFTTYQALQRHVTKNIHDGKNYTENNKKTNNKQHPNKTSRECPSCHKEFEKFVELAEHIRKEHRGENLYQCKICEKLLGTQAALNRHEMNHSEERPYACPYCENRRYNYEAELKVHMQRHTTDPALLCPICKKARSDPEDLKKHIASHSKPHQCPKCGKIFRKAYNLHQHEMAVHLQLRTHKCRQCGMGFKGRKDLYLHKFHHDPNGRPETCPICGLYFKTKRALLRHMSKFHPDVEKPPEIKQIDFSDRPHCCTKCPLRFKTKRGLLLHTGKSHEKGQRQVKTIEELQEKYGPRSQICTVCQLQCYSKRGLSRHIRKSHPDMAIVIEQEKLSNRIESCTLCPLKFRTARGLLLHKKRKHRDMNAAQTLKNLDSEIEERKTASSLNWL